MFPLPFPEADERLGEAGDGRGGAEGGEAAGRGRAVEQSEQPEDGSLDVAALAFEPALVGGKDAEGVALSFFHFARFDVGVSESEAVAPGDVGRVEGEAQVTSHEGEGEGVAFDFGAGAPELGFRPGDAVPFQDLRAGGVGEVVEPPLRRRGVVGGRENRRWVRGW